MDRTFSTEYQDMKGQRAEQRSNKKKHSKVVDCGWPPGSDDHFRAEHGSTAAQKAQQPFFKETQWAARRRDQHRLQSEYEQHKQGDGLIGHNVQVRASRSKADRKKAYERRLLAQKPNKASAVHDPEQEEVEHYKLPKHTLVPSAARFFGPSAPARAPQVPRRRGLAAEEAPARRHGYATSVWRRAPGADALTQRTSALSMPGRFATGLDEVVKIVALRLRRLRPSNRPASGPVFERWLKHQSCCTVRADMLMTPGALAEALLPLLEDSPATRRAIAPFVNAGRGVDPKDPGPSAEDAEAAAERTRHQLRVVGEERFCLWPWPQCARWLCSQSYVLRRVEASAVLAELRRLGAVVDGSADGRMAYDEAVLASIKEPARRGAWCVMDLEKVARMALCRKTKVHLGWGLPLRERVESLKLAELANLKAEWLASAAARLGEKAPGIMSLRAKFNKASTAVVLYTCVLGSQDSVPPEEAVQAIAHTVKADISERHSPKVLWMENLAFRGPLRALMVLERWLNCSIELERDGDGCFTGNASVHLSRRSTATFEQVQEILKVTFSPEPAIRCPGLLKADEAAWLAEEPLYQHELARLFQTATGAVLEAWQPEEAERGEDREEGSLDLCGWLSASVWADYEGDLDGAPAWFLGKAVPLARERMVKHWEDRLAWFPEGRERGKALLREGQRQVEATEKLQEDLLSGKKVVIAGGSDDLGGGYAKRW